MVTAVVGHACMKCAKYLMINCLRTCGSYWVKAAFKQCA